MLHAFAISAPSLLLKGAEGHRSAGWGKDSDALAALRILGAGRDIDTEPGRRAMALLAGLPRWLTAMIVTRHAQTQNLCSIDMEITNILLEFEDEGVLGPAS
jgi:hypothetical protein